MMAGQVHRLVLLLACMLQVVLVGRPGQGSTLDVAGRRELLQLPATATARARGPLVRLRSLQLVNLPYVRFPCDCRSLLQALMHWVSVPCGAAPPIMDW